jgi:hypothetical protein
MATFREIEATRYDTEDANGHSEVVIEWVTVATSQPLSGGSAMCKSRNRRWSLLDGSDVRRIDDDTFQVLETDVVLWKVR